MILILAVSWDQPTQLGGCELGLLHYSVAVFLPVSCWAETFSNLLLIALRKSC